MIINLNGDSQETLIAQLIDLNSALDHLTKMAAKSAPHERNYPGQQTQYEKDRQALTEAMVLLKKFSDYVTYMTDELVKAIN